MAASRLKIFAGVTPGLERLLSIELSVITPSVSWKIKEGGLEAFVSREDMWAVAHRSRLVELVRVRIGEFRATNFPDLIRKCERLNWPAYFPRLSSPPRISAACRRSVLYHSGAVEERVLRAMALRGIVPPDHPALRRDRSPPPPPPPHMRRAGGGGGPAAAGRGAEEEERGEGWEGEEGEGWEGGEEEEGPPRVHVRVESDHVQVSVDCAGPALHKRGYRKHVLEAPLRETLAAACLHAARYHIEQGDAGDGPAAAAVAAADGPGSRTQGYRPLLAGRAVWDPLCGAGTVPIEAAAEALGLDAVVGPRAWPYERWPCHDPAAHAAFRAAAAARPRERGGAPHSAVGSDTDPLATRAAAHNSGLAGTEAVCRWVEGDPAEVAPSIDRDAVVVTNMPYGVRVRQGAALSKLHKAAILRPDIKFYVLGLRGALDAVVTGSRKRWVPVLSFQNRGLPVDLCHLA